jgi:hypothetical protein
MSKLTDSILCGIDYDSAKQRRRLNYAILDKALKDSNRIRLELDDEAAPMVYPYWTKDASLRRKLIENKVFVATYWPNVKEWTKEGMLERKLAEDMIPVPCDQRYDSNSINQILFYTNEHQR